MRLRRIASRLAVDWQRIMHRKPRGTRVPPHTKRGQHEPTQLVSRRNVVGRVRGGVRQRERIRAPSVKGSLKGGGTGQLEYTVKVDSKSRQYAGDPQDPLRRDGRLQLKSVPPSGRSRCRTVARTPTTCRATRTARWCARPRWLAPSIDAKGIANAAELPGGRAERHAQRDGRRQVAAVSGRRVGEPGEVGVDPDQRRVEVRHDERWFEGDGVDQALSGACGPASERVRAQRIRLAAHHAATRDRFCVAVTVLSRPASTAWQPFVAVRQRRIATRMTSCESRHARPHHHLPVTTSR